MNIWLRNLTLLVLMLAASGLTLALHPTYKAVEQDQIIDLAEVIPREFGEWREEQNRSVQIVDPQQQETIDKIYTQTLSRTYVNTKGQRVMLSLAYGKQQDKESQIHRPEVCYPSQGFTILSEGEEQISTPYASIPTQRLVATKGSRIEPVTYWIRIGDNLASGWFSQKIAVIKQGMRGQIADGLLFRVSSLSGDSRLEYSAHDKFILDLLKETAPESRYLLVGRP
jgi:EpsI family protein